MRRPAAHLAALITAVLVAVGSFAALAPPASASALPISQCSTSTNVILAVDFGHWGGPIVRACGSTPTTGFDLLNEGSFHTVGTQHDGPGFVCRIGSTAFSGDTEYPRPSEPGESCGPTPPASGYWAYWHASAGQDTWSYGQLGAMSYQPGPGSVDLWIFGATNIAGSSGSGTPQYSPDTVRARNSAPAPATSSSSAPTTHTRASTHSSKTNGPSSASTHQAAAHPAKAATKPGSTSASGTPASSSAATTSRARKTSASDTTTTVRTSGTARANAAAGTDTPTVLDAKPVAAKRGSAGSVWPVVAAILVLAALAGGTGLTVLRRRRGQLP